MPQQPDIWDQAAAEVAAEKGGQNPNTVTITPDPVVTITPDNRDSWDKAAAGADVFDQAAQELFDQADGSATYNKNTAPKLKQPVQVQSSLVDRLSGALAPQTVQKTNRRSSPADLNAFEGSYSSGDTDKGAFMTGAGVLAGSTLVGAAVAPRAITAAKALGAWVSANPVKAYLLYEAAKDLLPGHLHDLFKAAQKSPQ